MVPPAYYGAPDPSRFQTINESPLYVASGGAYSSLISSTASGSNLIIDYQKSNSFSDSVDYISEAFNLTKKQLKEILQIKSRKTLYNWINEESQPRKTTMHRLFDLRVLAEAWNHAGFNLDKRYLIEKVLNNKSLLDYLIQNDLDQDTILFIGSRLSFISSEPSKISDPFS